MPWRKLEQSGEQALLGPGVGMGVPTLIRVLRKDLIFEQRLERGICMPC